MGSLGGLVCGSKVTTESKPQTAVDAGVPEVRSSSGDALVLDSQPHSPDTRRLAAMGNASSSGRGHHDETVDFGYLTPQGIYTGPRDWNQGIVTHLIADRKLAPFYRPLEDYDESWDDEQILAAMKEPPQADGGEPEQGITRADSSSLHSGSSRTHHKRPSTNNKEQTRHVEAAVYRGAVECPICFLVCSFSFRRVISLTEGRLPSIIPLISTILVAATKLYAQSASYK